MKAKSKPNLPIAFASLLLSLMLWFVVYVQNAPEPTPVRAALALDGLDADRLFVKKSPNDLRLDVSLPPDRAKEIAEQQVAASIDLSEAKEGTAEYPVTISPAWIVRYLSGPRPTVRLTLEKVDHRTMPVRIIVTGAFDDPKMRLNETRAVPKEVEVVGPASEVASVRNVRAYVDLSKIDLNNNEYQQIDVVPSDVNAIRPPHVRTTPDAVMVSVSFGPSPTTKVASIVADLGDVTYDTTVVKSNGYGLDPQTVLITGKPEILANVSKVPTEIVRAHDLKGDRTVTVGLIAPAGTEIVGDKTVRVLLRTLPASKPRASESRPTETKPSRATPPPKEPKTSAFPETVPPLNR